MIVYEESKFVTCLECEDYDLCIPCHTGLKHGHHPAHTFKRVSDETVLSTESSILCAPGRNMRHAAICDGCDKACSTLYCDVYVLLTSYRISVESVTNV